MTNVKSGAPRSCSTCLADGSFIQFYSVAVSSDGESGDEWVACHTHGAGGVGPGVGVARASPRELEVDSVLGVNGTLVALCGTCRVTGARYGELVELRTLDFEAYLRPCGCALHACARARTLGRRAGLVGWGGAWAKTACREL